MISLIFDTETTGKVQYDIPYGESGQPHLVELAFELYDQERDRVMAEADVLVNPGVEIPSNVVRVHGITTEIASRFGVRPLVAAALFSNFMNLADRFVCHNVKFDIAMMMVEYTRLGKPISPILEKRSYCTMNNSTNALKLEYKSKDFKWPTLEEAYKGLVDPKGFSGMHQAINDVRATRKILMALEKRKRDKR
jgi:DNA polymerase III epsilon subunit-like protein